MRREHFDRAAARIHAHPHEFVCLRVFIRVTPWLGLPPDVELQRQQPFLRSSPQKESRSTKLHENALTKSHERALTPFL